MSDTAGKPLDPWVRARDVAAHIQQAVHEATGLSCSIGVTPNKLLSKMASELDKPAGRLPYAKSTASAPRPPHG